MDLQFQKTILSCLEAAVREVQNSEQTQEIKVPDSMPDIRRIISAWGQCILRGKEWRSDSISFSGGMMTWVLYEGEDGSGPRCLDAWVPFQMRWTLPPESREGAIRITCLPRFVDARSVSPRKIMVRCSMAALGEAYVPMEAEVFSAGEQENDIQLLKTTYPVRLDKEAGEKPFLLEEELLLPGSAPQPEQIIYCRMNPRVTDRKVLGNKVVFRGSGDLHTLYRSEEGQMHSWDFELPFSQYADLEGEYGPDAQADMTMAVTNLEVSVDEEGHMQLKAGLLGQYVIRDQELVETVEDAYLPGRELTLKSRELTLPAVLEVRREELHGEQTIPAEANVASDISFQPDFPRQRRSETGVELELPGTFQVLYYGEDGTLRSGVGRWEGQQHISAHEDSQLIPLPGSLEPQAALGSGQILAKAEIPMEMTTVARQRIPMITELTEGPETAPDTSRPSLILRRAGEGRLWDIAKGCGSTMEAIRRANNLQNEPTPGQMLLIPVG